MKHRLSKSKILSGIQCQKRLWLEVHRPDLLEYDQNTLVRMQTGHKVGEIACQYLAPGGVYVGLENGFGHALEETQAHILSNSQAPIYEATFAHDQVLVRSDIVIPSVKGFDIIEVKSATSVRDYHVWDCAVQYRVIQGLGHKVKSIQVAVIDSSFIYPGGGDYHGLLRVENITGDILDLQSQVRDWINQCLKTLSGEVPEIEVGDHCASPFDCPFWDVCAPENRPEYPVECLPRIRGNLLQNLKQEGYEDIRDIPDNHLPNPNHERVRRVTVSGRAELLLEAKKILNAYPYPRYFLDFETAQLAVPVWKGTRPYQQLPFQWSCHVQSVAGQTRHLEFLDLTGNSPICGFAESLILACGDNGPIFVYASFEARVIRELIQQYPDLASSLEVILERIVDLLPIVRQHYYHPHMFGSWSLKAVLPCIAPDLDYSALPGIHDGGQAQEAYAEAVDPKTTPHRKDELRRSLSAYCKMDTFALVRIVGVLSCQGLQ